MSFVSITSPNKLTILLTAAQRNCLTPCVLKTSRSSLRYCSPLWHWRSVTAAASKCFLSTRKCTDSTHTAMAALQAGLLSTDLHSRCHCRHRHLRATSTLRRTHRRHLRLTLKACRAQASPVSTAILWKVQLSVARVASHPPTRDISRARSASAFLRVFWNKIDGRSTG